MEGSGSGGCDHYRMMEVEEDGYTTPTDEGCRIPLVAAECPPAPKRKRVAMKKQKKQQRSMPQKPKDSYFQHPDLDILFKMMSTTREPYVLQLQACFEREPGGGCY
ncbi:hypothetical protein ACH5RR_019266 [Cinchona calisaya]|uniref:Uncharacterized protein n=1 Tax=Cinchona calisaya TaxID=153742 RepID=A0ABD2ZSI1_9GENT